MKFEQGGIARLTIRHSKPQPMIRYALTYPWVAQGSDYNFDFLSVALWIKSWADFRLHFVAETFPTWSNAQERMSTGLPAYMEG